MDALLRARMAQALEGNVGGPFPWFAQDNRAQVLDEDEDQSSLTESSSLGQPGAAAKEEKKMKKSKSSASPDAEVKTKRVVIRVQKSKNTTKFRVPDSDSLYQLRDYPEDDDLEFIAHELTLNEGEQGATGKSDHEVDPPLAREPYGETEIAASREAAPVPKEASVLHHESFLWPLLKISHLQFKLKENVQEKVDLIDQLREELDDVKVTNEAWKGRMDLLASEKEAAKEEMASVKEQLWGAKDKVDKWSRLNDEFRAQLNSTITELDALGQESNVLRYKLEETSIDSSDIEEMLAQYKANME
ncbi:uncharacterized protein [Nicotiana tomentosiformis]|uniref:uncharacterized protein n=1 Tax=Nicotiana tomentosiformis TaxID=4098 RepID=UPI00388C3E28